MGTEHSCIKVRKKTRQRLNILKASGGFKSVDDLINFLIIKQEERNETKI